MSFKSGLLFNLLPAYGINVSYDAGNGIWSEKVQMEIPI